jgi:formylglycine-generating enzyme required for sulfatase activity
VAATAAVSNVDWCDAFAYCAFAGKRLCGKIGGGPVAADAAADPAQDEWFAACSHADDGQHAFPYGNVYDAATCNASSGARVAVGSFPGCVGGYPGLFDMAGNVWEWENRCLRGAAADAATDPCGTRGGGFSSGTSSTCANAQSDLRSTALEKVGFRCCAN